MFCLNKYIYIYYLFFLIKYCLKFECVYIKINYLYLFINDIIMLMYMQKIVDLIYF